MQFIVEKSHLPLILGLLKVIYLLVLSPKAHQLILVIVKMELPTGHSRKILCNLVTSLP
jgi:hypothetical protein